MSMLKGDKFTLDQWAQAVKKPVGSTGTLPVPVEQALYALHQVCKEFNVPVLTVMCSGKQTQSSWDMGNVPQEVTGQYLMARAVVANDAGHATEASLVVMRAMQQQ